MITITIIIEIWSSKRNNEKCHPSPCACNFKGNLSRELSEAFFIKEHKLTLKMLKNFLNP